MWAIKFNLNFTSVQYESDVLAQWEVVRVSIRGSWVRIPVVPIDFLILIIIQYLMLWRKTLWLFLLTAMGLQPVTYTHTYTYTRTYVKIVHKLWMKCNIWIRSTSLNRTPKIYSLVTFFSPFLIASLILSSAFFRYGSSSGFVLGSSLASWIS